jgi:hypothetical protein
MNRKELCAILGPELQCAAIVKLALTKKDGHFYEVRITLPAGGSVRCVVHETALKDGMRFNGFNTPGFNEVNIVPIRDDEKRRTYFREYMRKRRADKSAAVKPVKPTPPVTAGDDQNIKKVKYFYAMIQAANVMLAEQAKPLAALVDELMAAHDALADDYNALLEDYNQLVDDYNALLDDDGDDA